MSTFYSGNGGTITSGAVVTNVKQWTCNTGSRTTENTHSGTGGYTNYEHVVFDARWTAEGPLDTSNLPDSTGLFVPGTKVSAKFKNGADARFILLVGTIIEDYEVIDDNTSDIVRWRMSGKGGVITRMS